MQMTVQQLHHLCATLIARNLDTVPVVAEGFNEMGDLVQLPLRGDARMTTSPVGTPVIVIR
jgi:hypothetical protein